MCTPSPMGEGWEGGKSKILYTLPDTNHRFLLLNISTFEKKSNGN